MVSIIIPNYNRLLYLEQALQSILVQTYSNWEVIVVDDGSTDESIELVKSYSDSDNRIKWIERRSELKGASVCRNIGINEAMGEYIIFLDSDDLLAPHCLNQRVKVMNENSELDFAVFKMQFFKNIPGDDIRIWNLENNQSVEQRFLNLDSVWQTTGPIWRTSALQKIGGFNNYLQCWQDIDLHLKVLFAKLNFKFFYDQTIDCYYRKDSSDSISQSNTNSLVKLNSKVNLVEWIDSQQNELCYNSLQMKIHILLSAINGHQFGFFYKAYKKYQKKIPRKYKKNIFRMLLIRILRLYKLKYFKNSWTNLSKQILIENTIGKFYV